MNTITFCLRYDLCHYASEYISQFDTLEEAWLACENPSWMITILEKISSRQRNKGEYAQQFNRACKNLIIDTCLILASHKITLFSHDEKYIFKWAENDLTDYTWSYLYRFNILLIRELYPLRLHPSVCGIVCSLIRYHIPYHVFEHLI